MGMGQHSIMNVIHKLTTCIICDQHHNRLWLGEPAHYCPACATLRDDVAGKVTQVIGNLYLGDALAAQTFDGTTLCVHESKEYVTQHHIPILSQFPKSHSDRTGALVSMYQLEHAVEFIIHHLVDTIDPVLVHCAGGVERSPLTIAYFLSRYQPHFLIEKGWRPTFHGAYSYLQSIRPVVARRISWLPTYQQQLINLTEWVYCR